MAQRIAKSSASEIPLLLPRRKRCSVQPPGVIERAESSVRLACQSCRAWPRRWCVGPLPFSRCCPPPSPSMLDPSVQTVWSLSYHLFATSRVSTSFPIYYLPWKARILPHPCHSPSLCNPATARSPPIRFDRRRSRRALAGVSALSAATMPEGVRKAPRE